MRNYLRPEYRIWAAMKHRCKGSKDPSHKWYKIRRISVCQEWHDFQFFFDDMGERPSSDHSIERIDNNGNYCKENCRWATNTEQQRNKNLQANNTSGVTGVNFDKRRNKYRVRIKVSGKEKWVGYYPTLDEAKAARKEAELRYW